ncbi:MAG TPA: enoyl-CoA hydratase-related protein [Acetobacteraceae bacterium]|jgi:crotonobetainyl-CoA hydratase|nr:enoyl-CoA hydratase-related protein [Acetobacteraceae bacterium]
MTIRLEIAGPVARVTIDRTEVLNALDQASTDELEAIWQRLESDADIRAIVLTGAGERAFCAGADMRAGGDRTGLEYWALGHPTGFGALSLRPTLDIPVIARVNGHALGGGLEMMLGCDIAVAAAHATFGLPEPRVGRLPIDGGMVLLPRLIGYRRAMGMMLTGRRIDAATALDYGLINEIAPAAELNAAVDRWLADILACAPLSLRAVKQTARRTAQLTVEQAQALRLPAAIACLTSQDGEEGVRAFLEKRPPLWSGR